MEPIRLTLDSLAEKKLIKLLQKEKNYLTRLLQLTRSEKGAIMESRHEELDGLTIEKKAISNNINKIEEERLEITGEATLEQVAAGSQERSQELFHLRQELKDLTMDLKFVNKANAILLRQALDFTRYAIELLNPDRVRKYGSSGEIEGKNKITGSARLNGKV